MVANKNGIIYSLVKDIKTNYNVVEKTNVILLYVKNVMIDGLKDDSFSTVSAQEVDT